MGAPKWDDSRIERLRADWDAGLPKPMIAQRLGTTKAAVVGKAKRLGLLERPAPQRKRLDKDP